jgi:ribosomal protein S18 acetylase RimI-like enzyme
MMNVPPHLTLRPITPADSQFLLQVYSSTREEELAQVAWQPGQKEAFLQMQFSAQHEHYQQHYIATSYDVILVDGAPAGRLYLARWAAEYRIVDIALLPEFRGRGVGSALLQLIIAEAASHGLPVSIHVEQFNPALRWYKRLGFQHVSEHGVYYLLRRAPAEETTNVTS